MKLKTRTKALSWLLSLVLLLSLMTGMSLTANAAASISGTSIDVFGSASGTVSSDMTCTWLNVFDSSTLTINQGVTVTLNNPGRNFAFFDNSKIELHGTLAGSAGSDAVWMDRSYINVYLSDGAKYTVTGLSCMDDYNGKNEYLIYYGYDAATDGNGTVSVKNGSTDVTSTSKGYKATTYIFTATPSDGYKFVNWTKGPGGDELGTDTSINITCEQNGQYQVYANFEADAPAVTESTYTLTIPSTLTVANSGWNATDGISATGTLASGKKLTVTASSANSWALKSGDNTVSYTLTTAEGGSQTTSWEFTTLDGTAQPMGIIVENYDDKPAGTYQDTVTFTAKVEDAKPLYSITFTGPYTGDVLVMEYYLGDTWNDMASKYPDYIKIYSGRAAFGRDGFIYDHNGSMISATAQIDPNETYEVQ